MQNKIIINLIVANLLWSFIPVIVSGLFNEVSVLMVIFLRFLVSGVILFLLAILMIFVNNRFTSNKKIPFEVLKIIYTHKNRSFFG
jgi:drug/metabolite transporter (DMT)-like permease